MESEAEEPQTQHGRKRKTRASGGATAEAQIEQLMKRHATPSRGRVDATTGRLHFAESLESDFARRSQDPRELQEAYRPPYLEPLESGELQELNDFFQSYSQRSQTLNADPVFAFVRHMSAFTREPLENFLENYDLLKDEMGRGGRPNFVPGVSNGPRFLTVGEQTTAGLSRPQAAQQTGRRSPPPPPPPPPGQATFAVGPGGSVGGGLLAGIGGGGGAANLPRVAAQREEVIESEQTGQQRTAYDLLAHPRHEQAASDFLRRQRQLNGMRWLAQPLVLGFADMTPRLQGHVTEAYDILMRSLLHLPSDLPVEVFITDPVIQAEFARLVMFRMKMTDFFTPTRNSFDANLDRLETQQTLLLHALQRYQWDAQTQGFVAYARNGQARLGDPKSMNSNLFSTRARATVRRPVGTLLPRWR